MTFDLGFEFPCTVGSTSLDEHPSSNMIFLRTISTQFRLPIPLLILTTLKLTSAVTTVSISVPTSVPAGSQTVSPSLISLSIEADRWAEWIGTTSPNTFMLNALLNLNTRTGIPPKIRIGANSADRTTFSPSVNVRRWSTFLYSCTLTLNSRKMTRFQSTVISSLTLK